MGTTTIVDRQYRRNVASPCADVAHLAVSPAPSLLLSQRIGAFLALDGRPSSAMFGPMT